MASTFRAVRGNRNLQLFFGGLFISMTGFWMQFAAEAWLVTQLGGKGKELGFAGVARFLPLLAFGAYAGVIADRYAKWKLLYVTQIAQAAFALAIAVLITTGHIRLWNLYLLTFGNGFAAAIDNPVRRSFLNELVPEHDVTNAVGLSSTVYAFCRSLGPALAGLSIKFIGIDSCFYANAVTYAALLIALHAMKREQFRAVQAPRRRGQLADGLRYARTNSNVWLSFTLMAVVGTLAFNYQVVVPLLNESFDGGPGSLGFIMALSAAGSIPGSLITARRSAITPAFLVGTAFAVGATTALAAASFDVVSAAVLFFVVGIAGAAYVASSNAIIQTSAIAEMQGRMAALMSVLFLGSTPIGGPIVGAVSDWGGARAGLLLGGGASIAIAAWAWTRRGFAAPRAPAAASVTS